MRRVAWRMRHIEVDERLENTWTRVRRRARCAQGKAKASRRAKPRSKPPSGRLHFYPPRVHYRKKKSCTSPAEPQRARRDSDGTGLCSPIMHAALAALWPIEARVGLHEDGCRAVLVSSAHNESSCGRSTQLFQ